VKSTTLYNSCGRVRVRAQAQTNYDGRKTPHPSPEKAFKKNASTFDIKCKCVSLQTQGRFTSNASAFWMERKGVFFTNKNKRKYYTEMGIKKGVPLNSNLC